MRYLLFGILVLTFLGLPDIGQTTVYVSDHFDSQADYDGCTDPPAPWSSYSWSNASECNRIGINSSQDAHGGGKAFQINWPSAIMELGCQYRQSPTVGTFWTGFWWKHNANYVMTEQDKFIYFPENNGNRTMLSHINNSLCYFDGSSYSLCANTGANPYPDPWSSAWQNDTSWHSYVVYVNAADKELRVWRDGDELTWDSDNLNVRGWNSSTFDADFWYWGYQSRVGWTNNISWFDDIILASTEDEVIDFLGVTESPSPPPADPEPPNAEQVLLQESFDDSATAARGWYDSGSTSPIITTDAQNGNVLEFSYSSGASTPTTGALRHSFTETSEVTLSYDVKYQSDWSWVAGDSGPHEFYLLTNLDHDYKGPAETHGTTYIEMHNGQQRLGFQDALNIDQTRVGIDLTNISENRGVFGCNGSSDTYSDGICWGSSGAKINGKLWDVDMAPIQNDRWYQVKVHFRMNSIVNGIGIADGVMEYWLDGQLKMSLDNVMIRTGENANMKWNQIMIGPYFHNGTPKAQKFWIDNLTIDGTSIAAPSPPTGLRIF